MNTDTFENEALKTLTLHAAQFPQANHCIASMGERQNIKEQIQKISVQQANAPKGPEARYGRRRRREENEADADLQVIWAGWHDIKSNRVICQLTSKDSSILNSYYVKVVDQAGKIIAHDRFVAFDQDIAFASLIVPKIIFDQCSVQMDMVMIGEEVRTASKVIPLDIFDVQNIKAEFQVDAPKVTRAGSHDKIRISYYRNSSVKDYDYVYPGRNMDQMYFPSAGRITLEGIELHGASGNLMISDGRKEVTCSEPEVMEVSDSVITYSFKERWEGTKLSDCFDLTNVFAKADYLLTIDAIDRNGYIITLMITNIASMIDKGDIGSIKQIQEINVYLDCFAQGTEIRMADGSRKPVEDIQKGDLVKIPGGGQASVRKTQVQEDCQVINIKLVSGRVLSVTDGHAVDTTDGVFPAIRLKEEQEVLTEDGTDRILQVIPHCERRYTVYALFLDGNEEWLYAGGIKVHSSDCGDVFRDRDWVREDLAKEWRSDYDNALKAGLLYGRR